MSATHANIDLDDSDGLIAADREGLLRSASMAGAQVRSTAAAVDEGALDSVRTGQRPRSLIWVSGRGPAESAGAILGAVLGGSSAEPIVVAAEVPPWIGPLDVLIVAGDDAADPTLVGAAATAVRRGARVVVAAPYEGPLRDATAGRVAVLEPRLWVRDEFSLSRYLAVGLATLQAAEDGAATGAALRTNLGVLADELDAEALRNSAGREVLTNAAKSLADRLSGRSVVVAGDNPSTLALARHLSIVWLRVAQLAVAAAGLADSLVALRAGMGSGFGSGASALDALFHDEELDGPLPDRPRVLALTLAAERPLVSAKTTGDSDIVLVGTEDVPDGAGPAASPADVGRPEQQLAVLALRLEMAAVYMRLARG